MAVAGAATATELARDRAPETTALIGGYYSAARERLEPTARTVVASATAAASTAAAVAAENAPRAREQLSRLSTRAVEAAVVAAERASEVEQTIAGTLGRLIVGAGNDDDDLLLAAAEVGPTPQPQLACDVLEPLSTAQEESVPVTPELVEYVDTLRQETFRSLCVGMQCCSQRFGSPAACCEACPPVLVQGSHRCGSWTGASCSMWMRSWSGQNGWSPCALLSVQPRCATACFGQCISSSSRPSATATTSGSRWHHPRSLPWSGEKTSWHLNLLRWLLNLRLLLPPSSWPSQTHMHLQLLQRPPPTTLR